RTHGRGRGDARGPPRGLSGAPRPPRPSAVPARARQRGHERALRPVAGPARGPPRRGGARRPDHDPRRHARHARLGRARPRLSRAGRGLAVRAPGRGRAAVSRPRAAFTAAGCLLATLGGAQPGTEVFTVRITLVGDSTVTDDSGWGRGFKAHLDA